MRGRRKSKVFTEEERKKLLENKYTLDVTEANIFYTNEFKNLFWIHYQAGEGVKSIFKQLGYDVNILGNGRIYNFSHKLSEDMKSGSIPIKTNIKENKETLNTKYSDEEIKAMEYELTYLRQEVSFLKKILSLGKKKK